MSVVRSGVKAKKWVVKWPFSGYPKREDLEIVEEELPPLKDGGKQPFTRPQLRPKGYISSMGSLVLFRLLSKP